MNIIGPKPLKVIAAPFKWAANNKSLQKKMDFALKNPAEAAAKMLLLSIVSKDAVGCLFYTYQSWNNEKIPESKRKFVAMTDLMNGLVMVGGQIFAGKVVENKISPWIKSKYTGEIKEAGLQGTTKGLHPDNLKSKARELAETITKGKNLPVAQVERITTDAVKSLEKNLKSPFLAGLGIIVTTIFTTALTKRVLAPLFSTPMAGYINNNFLHNKGNVAKDNRTSFEVAALAGQKQYAPEAGKRFDKMSAANG